MVEILALQVMSPLEAAAVVEQVQLTVRMVVPAVVPAIDFKCRVQLSRVTCARVRVSVVWDLRVLPGSGFG